MPSWFIESGKTHRQPAMLTSLVDPAVVVIVTHCMRAATRYPITHTQAWWANTLSLTTVVERRPQTRTHSRTGKDNSGNDKRQCFHRNWSRGIHHVVRTFAASVSVRWFLVWAKSSGHRPGPTDLHSSHFIHPETKKGINAQNNNDLLSLLKKYLD